MIYIFNHKAGQCGHHNRLGEDHVDANSAIVASRESHKKTRAFFVGMQDEAVARL